MTSSAGRPHRTRVYHPEGNISQKRLGCEQGYCARCGSHCVADEAFLTLVFVA